MRGRDAALLVAASALLAGCGPETPAPPKPVPTEAARAPRVDDAAPASRPPRAQDGAGRVALKVIFRGDPPPPRPIVIPDAYRRRAPADAALCDRESAAGRFLDESLRVDPETRGVRDVAAAFRLPEGVGPPPPPRAVLENVGARFVPRLQFAPVGASVRLVNADPIEHATALSTVDGSLLCNTTIRPDGAAETPELEQPGVYVATCPLHAWMRATVVATRHGAVGVTDARGEAVVAGAPAGPATLVLWHEALGTATRRVDVPAEGVASVEVGSDAFARPK